VWGKQTFAAQEAQESIYQIPTFYLIVSEIPAFIWTGRQTNRRKDGRTDRRTWLHRLG